MSLLGNATLANISTPYYSGGGGGGGATSSFTVVNASSLTVSTIAGVSGLGPYFSDGLEIGAAGEISFEGGLGVMTGVSSINGAAYPPPAAAASLSTPLVTATVGSVPVFLSQAPFATAVGQWYTAQMSITDIGFFGTMGADDSYTIAAGSPAGYTPLALLDCPRLSTLRGFGAGGGSGSIGLSVSGPLESFSTFADFIVIPNNVVSVSSLMSTAFRGWLTPLDA